MKETKQSILDRLPAKWIFAIVAIVGFVLAIYSTFFKRNYPQLECEILSKVSVFNHQEEVSSLRILLDTVDVQKNNANITFYTLKMSNNGTMHINHDMYDRSPFGLQVKNAYIVKGPTIIEASNNYIKSRLEEISIVKNSDLLYLPYLPLDIGDFFVIKLGLYHDNANMPSFICKGKISGQKQINIIDLSNAKKELYFKQVIHGKWHVQIVRLILYGIGFIAIIIAILYAFVLLTDILSKWRRLRQAQSLKDLITDKVRQDYIEYGEYHIVSVYNIICLSEAKLNSNYNTSKNYIANLSNSHNKEQLSIHQYRMDEYDNLAAAGYLKKQKNKIEIDIQQKKSVITLYDWLKAQNMVS